MSVKVQPRPQSLPEVEYSCAAAYPAHKDADVPESSPVPLHSLQQPVPEDDRSGFHKGHEVMRIIVGQLNQGWLQLYTC